MPAPASPFLSPVKQNGVIASTNDGTIRMDRNFLRWGEKEEQEFLEHVLGGYPIPLIVIHGSVTNGGECVTRSFSPGPPCRWSDSDSDSDDDE